jgi:hypothetical protein
MEGEIIGFNRDRARFLHASGTDWVTKPDANSVIVRGRFLVEFVM